MSSSSASSSSSMRSQREAKLRLGFSKVIRAWRANVDGQDGLRAAFGQLYADHAAQLGHMYDEVWRNFERFMGEELDDMTVNAGLPARMAALEALQDLADKAALPAPASVMPEDEIRSAVVESSLAYEGDLRRLLDSMRSDNDSLEAEVAEMDSQARRITGRVGELKALFEQVLEQLEPPADDGAQEVEDDGGGGSGSSNAATQLVDDAHEAPAAASAAAAAAAADGGDSAAAE